VVFNWWSTESERLGFAELESAMELKHPNVKVVNDSIEGGGNSGHGLLQTRFAAGEPPDSFLVHAGKEAQDYVAAKQVSDISAFYEESGLAGVFPKDLVGILFENQKFYCVPVSVHRGNVLWASALVLKDAGVKWKEFANLAEFIAALDQVKAAAPGVIPLAIGSAGTQVHLLETVLIAQLGADGYRGLFDGTTDWKGEGVTKALRVFATLMTYTNADRDNLDWEGAAELIVEKKAAFYIMGDWVPALTEANKWTLGKDYYWSAVPGTAGIFDLVVDSFALAAGAKHPDGAKAWLDVISSKDAQLALNKANGAIPARIDIDLEDFSQYQQAAAKSFAKDKLVGSIQHGVAATVKQNDETNAATEKFTASAMAEADLQKFQDALAAAFAVEIPPTP
jgi:glucose/mannose transport system substrate-binding protein